MTSAFISYSAQDEQLAKNLYSATKLAGIETFLAGISINPGSSWTEEIFDHLEKATWVFFLATKNSISSPAVQQELGASLVKKKTIIPLLIDINPGELPGWVGAYQAIDLRSGPDVLHKTLEQIAEKIKIDKFWAGIIMGAIIVGLLVLVTRS